VTCRRHTPGQPVCTARRSTGHGARRVIPRDAIPSVDDPTFGSGYDGDATDRVLVYDSDDGPPRAYPLRYLDYHEIANDAADRPIAVTWCPLCGSTVVYDRRPAAGTLSADAAAD